MGIVVLMVALFGILLSIIAVVKSSAVQRRLRKDGKGCSWPVFLVIAFVMTALSLAYGSSMIPEDLATNSDAWMSGTFLISAAPGIGFISAYIYTTK